MSAVLQITASNISRFVRNRSFFVLALLAPFGIIAALSATMGDALTGIYRPELVIADEMGGGSLDPLITGLREAGFEDLDVVADAGAARQMVEDGEAEAAIIYSRSSLDSMFDPGAEPAPIVIVGDADADIATSVAEAVAQQSGTTFDTIRILNVLGAPIDDLSGPLAIAEQEAGVRVLTDSTYFAVGMTSYFAFFAASALVATVHRERRESTLARMLVAPINRFAPLAGKGLAAGLVALLSYVILVVTSTLLLGADWGPPMGSIAIGVGLCFSAVGIALAIVSVTSTEESAAQIGAAVATAWAIFGGVFIPIPLTGALASLAKLSPFRWAVDGIGLNAGVGSIGEVLVSAAVVAAFGLVGIAIALVRRDRLVGV